MCSFLCYQWRQSPSHPSGRKPRLGTFPAFHCHSSAMCVRRSGRQLVRAAKKCGMLVARGWRGSKDTSNIQQYPAIDIDSAKYEVGREPSSLVMLVFLSLRWWYAAQIPEHARR